MYKLMQFIDISDGHPGMLIPIFSSNSTNLPYVQQMDEYFQIKEMLPFLDYENYNLVVADHSRTVSVTDRGLVAFRSTDNSIVCGNPAEIIQYIGANRELIQKSAHLNSQLLRIEGEKLASMYEPWTRVSKESFEHPDQQAFWLSSEVSLFQSQSRIWDEIDSKDKEKSGERIGFNEPVGNYSTEYLIRWLSDRSHFIFSDWVKIWHYVNERNPFEQRLVDVAHRWLFSSQAGDLAEARSILFTLLHHARFSRGALGELGELGSFLSDEFSDSPFSIFYFLRPSELFANLFWFLGNYGDPQSVGALARFCVSELPREAYIATAIVGGLEILADRANDEVVSRDALGLVRELQNQ